MKIIEKWGTGIPRIFRECREYGLPDPELSEAVRRIKEYESVGFILYDTKENNDEAAFSSDYLYYKIQLE